MPNPELLDNLRSYLTQGLAEGFRSPAIVLSDAIEVFSDDAPKEEVTEAAHSLVDDLIADRELAMLTWPEITDCDRLDAAFEELNAEGIMARHNWTCCDTCGRAEMPAEFDRLSGQWNDKPIIGYTFYHWQGTESAVEGDGLYLSYGSTQPADSEPEYEQRCLDVAHTICRTLQRHGLTTTWDGTYAQKIAITLDWKRRKKPPRFYGDESFQSND